jgi:uncharacterized membrane protein YkoI
MKKRIGPIITMTLVAGLLAGLGYWQFAGVGLTTGGEYEDDESEHESERDWQSETRASTPAIASVQEYLLAEYGGRVIDMESEDQDGRALYAVSLVDADGRRREVLVDRETGETLRGGR